MNRTNLGMEPTFQATTTTTAYNHRLNRLFQMITTPLPGYIFGSGSEVHSLGLGEEMHSMIMAYCLNSLCSV